MSKQDLDSKTKKLNELFEKWKQKQSYGDSGFVPDGIIDENYWINTSRRVLFLMKEYNANHKSASDASIRENCDDFRKVVRDRPWLEVGRWAYGLQNVTDKNIPSFEDADKNYEIACKSSAILNLKKVAGRGIANEEKILEVAKEDLELINEELVIIQPNVVICCGTFLIVKEIILPEFEHIKAVDHPYSRCYPLRNSPWIDYTHPSARYPSDIKYYTLMLIYQNYLLSIGDRVVE